MTVLYEPVLNDIDDLDGDQDNRVQLSLREINKQFHALEKELDPVQTEEHAGCDNTGSGTDGATDPLLDDNETVFKLGPCFLTCDQYAIVSAIVSEDAQKLIMMHGGGGCGKSHAIFKCVDEISARGGRTACCCYTGVGASPLPNGQTFSSMWKTFVKDLNAGQLVNHIFSSIGGNSLRLVIIDEVSMLPADFLVLLDERLRTMYQAHLPFGGISILLVGDFLQLPVTSGHDLYRVMYSGISSQDLKARALFERFRVYNMKEQMRAGKCADHCRRLDAFRALPKKYPTGCRWTEADSAFRPITDDVVDGLTVPLTAPDVAADSAWLTDSVCLVTSNRDRAVINAARAPLFAMAKGQVTFRWRRRLRREMPRALQALLYDEEANPELFGYFVSGAPGQILDNGNGNVVYGVANGMPCIMVSIAWDNADDLRAAQAALAAHDWRTASVVDLPTPPDHIIVALHGVDVSAWPRHLNVAPRDVVDAVHIPIGLMTRKSYSVKVGKVSVKYAMHAVDISLAVTAWKCQGATLQYVLALLEPSPGSRSLSFELLYVMFSRVRMASHFRCFPLSPSFRSADLK